MLSIGIVGLPNVGKSTIFNALIKAKKAAAENYPFCTIDPNIGVVEVPDPRLLRVAELERSEKITPAAIQFVDIAGLVAGAHKGEGLGNQFLAHIREVDAIVLVLRYFRDPDIIHVAGKVDPEEDYKTIMIELCMADLQTLGKRIAAEESNIKSGVREATKKLEIYKKLETGLSHESPAKEIIDSLDKNEKDLIKDLNLLTAKPIIPVANISDDQIGQEITLFGKPIIAISAKTESELADLSPDEQKEYLASLGLSESGFDKLIREGYKTLGLITFLTGGPKEARAWTVRFGAKAPEAAGKIHTDFEKKFIACDVISFNDFSRSGGWQKAREQGLVRLEGKDYEIRDGDVIIFKHGQ